MELEKWSKLEQDANNLAPTEPRSKPEIMKSLSELQRIGNQMSSKVTAKAPKLGYTEYQYMASKGLDFDKTRDMLKDVDLAKMDTVSRSSTLDVSEYLRQEHERMLTEMIKNGHRESAERFRRKTLESLISEWDKEKHKVFQSLLYNKPAGDAARVALPDSAHLLSNGQMDWSHGAEKPLLSKTRTENFYPRGLSDPVRKAFAVKTRQLATSVANQPCSNPFVHYLECQMACAKDRNGPMVQREKSLALAELWDCAACLVHEMGRDGSISEDPHPQGYFSSKATDYGRLNELITGARTFLEKVFYNHIIKQIKANPDAAQRGGQPGILHDVMAFIQLKKNATNWDTSHLEMASNSGKLVPIWAVIFFCFRCGDIEGAIRAANLAQQCYLLRDALKAYSETGRRDVGKIKELIRAYRSEDKLRCTDPYKIAMYNLMGYCDPNTEVPMNEVMPHAESYLWIRLTMLWENAEGPPPVIPRSDVLDSVWGGTDLSLKQTAQVILEAGANHFNESSGLLFAKCLLMTQQFEPMINYLIEKQFRTEAVHFAIAFNHYGLLSPKVAEKMCQMAADYSRQLALYISKEFPVYYFYLMEVKFNGPSYSEVHMRAFLEYLSRESRSSVFGTISETENTVHLNGVLSKLYDAPTVCLMARRAAKVAERSGRFSYSVYLHSFSGDFRGGAAVLLKQIGRTVDKPGDHLEKQEVTNATRQFLLAIDASSRHPQRSLVQMVTEQQNKDLKFSQNLMNFFNYYHLGLQHASDRSRAWSKAESEVMALGIFPKNNGQFGECQAIIESWNPILLRLIPEVVLSLFKIWKTTISQINGDLLKRANHQDEARLKQVKASRDLLMSFYGCLRMRNTSWKSLSV